MSDMIPLLILMAREPFDRRVVTPPKKEEGRNALSRCPHPSSVTVLFPFLRVHILRDTHTSGGFFFPLIVSLFPSLRGPNRLRRWEFNLDALAKWSGITRLTAHSCPHTLRRPGNWE